MRCTPYHAFRNRDLRDLRDHKGLGFTLVELLIVVAIIGILTAIIYPNYSSYVVRSSREAAQTELLQLAGIQEKIYLNSNAYAGSMVANYNGTSGGGLGRSTALTSDRKYTLSITPTTPGQSYTLTATPNAGTTQSADGAITIDSTGQRLRNGVAW